MLRSDFRVYGVGYRIQRLEFSVNGFRGLGFGAWGWSSEYRGTQVSNLFVGTGSGSSLGLGLRLYALGFMSALSKEAEIGDPCL